MPQDFIKYTDKKLDGRFKILPEEYPIIKAKYRELRSSRKLAKEYGVDKGTILKIVNPAFLERQEKYNKGRWLIYYDKDYHTKAIKKFRDKKRKLKLVINRYRTN